MPCDYLGSVITCIERAVNTTIKCTIGADQCNASEYDSVERHRVGELPLPWLLVLRHQHHRLPSRFVDGLQQHHPDTDLHWEQHWHLLWKGNRSARHYCLLWS